MKPELAILLDDAGWPAFMVDRSGSVQHMNSAARTLFSGALDAHAPALAQIWSIENPTAAPQFLADWMETQAPAALIRFKLPQARAEACLTSFCRVGNLVLMQILPQNGNGSLDPKLAAERQKLDRALHLARTLTLEFNNALTGILGNASLLLKQMEPANPWRGLLVELEKSAQRAVEVANDLGTFSRQEKNVGNAVVGNLNLVIARALETVKQSTAAQEPIDWELQGEKKLFAVRFDENRLQPALIKVLENAAEALRKHRSVTIHTRNVELTEASQDRNVQLQPGTYVCVEVKDTGCGIDEAVLPRVFEPFFTTKPGSHRGLGLALAYGIVTNLGGAIAISTEPGAGTSVRVYLPAQRRFVEADAMIGPADGDGQTILIVDDEELLLSTEKAILTSYGYQVLLANTGEKALKLLQQKSSEVNLVITDLIMPTMSGKELISRIREEYPFLPVICTTGYVWPPGQQPAESDYLRKPFTAQQLLSRVAATLRRHAKEVD